MSNINSNTREVLKNIPSVDSIILDCYKNYKIPFVTWSHGGYGLVNSLPGFDVTDFKFCKNHISYGSYLKDFVDDSNCILKQLDDIGNNHNVMPVGSPRFDYDNRKKNLKKNLKTNNKKTIVFFKDDENLKIN